MSKSDKRHTQIDSKQFPYFISENLTQQWNPHSRRKSAAFDEYSQPQHSQLARSLESRAKAYESINLASPWSAYKQVYSLRLGSNFHVTVAEEMTFPYKEVFIRQTPGAKDINQLEMLKQIRHPNLVTILDTFQLDDTNHVVFETMPVSLGDIITSSLHIDTIRLAAILAQVVDGLTYLSEQRLEHGSLTCSNILVSREGLVKIAGYEHCYFRTPEDTKSRDMEALKCITTDLMGGYEKENGVTNLANPGNWDPVALDFLAGTTSATSARELIKASLQRTLHVVS